MRESSIQTAKRDPRTLRILAQSVYKQLKETGSSTSEVVEFTNLLLGLVTDELSPAQDDAA